MGSDGNIGLAAGAALDDQTTDATNAIYFSPAAANSPYRLHQRYLDGYLTPGSNAYGADADKISSEYAGRGILLELVDSAFDLSNAELTGPVPPARSYAARDAGRSDVSPDAASDPP